MIVSLSEAMMSSIGEIVVFCETLEISPEMTMLSLEGKKVLYEATVLFT